MIALRPLQQLVSVTKNLENAQRGCPCRSRHRFESGRGCLLRTDLSKEHYLAFETAVPVVVQSNPVQTDLAQTDLAQAELAQIDLAQIDCDGDLLAAKHRCCRRLSGCRGARPRLPWRRLDPSRAAPPQSCRKRPAACLERGVAHPLAPYESRRASRGSVWEGLAANEHADRPVRTKYHRSAR